MRSLTTTFFLTALNPAPISYHVVSNPDARLPTPGSGLPNPESPIPNPQSRVNPEFPIPSPGLFATTGVVVTQYRPEFAEVLNVEIKRRFVDDIPILELTGRFVLGADMPRRPLRALVVELAEE